MLNETDTVGATFRRAFRRIDGLVMYLAMAIWLIQGCYAYAMHDNGMELFISCVIAGFNAVLFVWMGLSRFPGLLTALLLVAFNLGFWL